MSVSLVNARDSANAELVRGGVSSGLALPATKQSISMLGGRFKVEHWRNGKRIDEFHFNNGITNEGKNKLLNVMFDSGTPITTWWLGAIDTVSYTQLQATDDYLDINQTSDQWKEFTNYTDGNNSDNATTRPAWGPGAASGQSITNATTAVFNITASGTVKGVFAVGGISNAQTKNDHTTGGTLWATALFSAGDVPVTSGDQLKVTYTVSC